jgi:hypothetical protein
LAAAISEGDSSIPLCVRDALAPIIRELQALNEEIAVSDHAIIDQRERPTSDERSWDRPCNGLRDRRECPGCRGLLWPTRVRSVPWIGAETELLLP